MPKATCQCSNCTRAPRPAVLRECVQCGQVFESRRGRTRCSAACRTLRDRESLRRSSTQRGSYRDRARFFGVAYEPFSRISIFERDGWVCGICRRAVDSSLAHPDLMSVSLDHIVPMSRGGAHTPSNTQCAHLICNIEKGATLPTDVVSHT